MEPCYPAKSKKIAIGCELNEVERIPNQTLLYVA